MPEHPQINHRPVARKILGVVLFACALAVFGPGYFAALRPEEGQILDFFKEWSAVKNHRDGIPVYSDQVQALKKHLNLKLTNPISFTIRSPCFRCTIGEVFVAYTLPTLFLSRTLKYGFLLWLQKHLTAVISNSRIAKSAMEMEVANAHGVTEADLIRNHTFLILIKNALNATGTDVSVPVVMERAGSCRTFFSDLSNAIMPQQPFAF